MSLSRSFRSLVGLSLCLGGLPLVGATPALARSTQDVSAGVSSQCTPRQGTFTVPANQTAVNFSIEHLGLGLNCGTLLALNDGGFEISRGRCPAQGGDVYWLAKTALSSTSSSPKLDALTLTPGDYCLSFNGGRDGGVRLSYTLIP
jgi:hypothetical protein